MQNQLQIFENEEFGKVRVLDIDSAPWFVGKDVAAALGYSNVTRDVKRHVDAEDKGVTEMVTPGGTQQLLIINESGLYSLIMSSKLPAAKKFKRWVTSEILPSLRKHGAYITEDTLEEMLRSSEFTSQLLDRLMSEREKNTVLKECVAELKPKARYYDLILQSKNNLPVSAISKDYGMSAVTFNRLLHDLKIQYKLGPTWLLYQEYANEGYTVSRTYHTGENTSVVHTYWTQKGRLFLYERLAWFGILPLTEVMCDMEDDLDFFDDYEEEALN